jgi:hypothetical protein
MGVLQHNSRLLLSVPLLALLFVPDYALDTPYKLSIKSDSQGRDAHNPYNSYRLSFLILFIPASVFSTDLAPYSK